MSPSAARPLRHDRTSKARLARLLDVCTALPEVEVSGEAHRTFRVRKKTFAYYLFDHHGDGLIALTCKAPPGEQERLVRNLGKHHVMILRNHGLLTAGRSASEAFVLLHMLERACEIQVAAVSNGARVRHITPESIATTHAVIEANSGFTRDWDAMLRLLDRIAPDYKD